MAASQHLGPRTHRRSTELSRAALVALERSSGGRTTSDCTSSWDTSTGGDEYDDGKGGSSYGKKKRGSSQTSSRLHSDNRGVVRDNNRRRNSNDLMISIPKCQPLVTAPDPNLQPMMYNLDNCVSSNGMDELLMQMMNPDCAPNYSLTNFNNDSDVRRQTDRDSSSSVSDEPDLSELHDPNSFSIRLSEKAISTRQLDERLGQFNGTDLLTLSRNNSDLSISVMENINIWIADQDSNNLL